MTPRADRGVDVLANLAVPGFAPGSWCTEWEKTARSLVPVTYHSDVPPGTRCPLKTHSHYRLVVKEVGRPLEEFSHGEALVNAIYYCVKAHSEAYAHGIIHRDISIGNMLIHDDGVREYGLLDGWELSKHLDNHNIEERQLDRTGTWEFLSVFAHHEPEKTILVPDELESFFHALLYMAIRFLPHNCQNVGAFIHDYFEDYLQVSNGDYRCGPAKKRAINVGHIDLFDQCIGASARLVFRLPGSNTPHPINKLIGDLFSWFSAYYHVKHEDAKPLSQRHQEGMGPLPESITEESSTERSRWAWDSDSDETDSDESELSSEDEAMKLKQEEKMRLRAQKLDTHKPLMSRLRRAVRNPRTESSRWPQHDKGWDKRPGVGYPYRNRDGTSESPSNTISNSNTAATLSPPAKGDTDHSALDTPRLTMTKSGKRSRSPVDGLELPSTPTKRMHLRS